MAPHGAILEDVFASSSPNLSGSKLCCGKKRLGPLQRLGPEVSTEEMKTMNFASNFHLHQARRMFESGSFPSQINTTKLFSTVFIILLQKGIG